jgi:16S rRNA (guanine(1405)-N(7))-methyltransferase
MADPQQTAIEQLAAEVQRSRKYAGIALALVRRLAAEELARGGRGKAAVKAVRNKLHQVGGAYQISPPDYGKWLDALRSAQGEEAVRQTCREIMAAHASTRERLPILSEIYTQLFPLLPPVTSVLDAACGLNPLTIPWMPLPPEAEYLACDIYPEMTAFLNQTFPLLGVTGRAEVCDLSAGVPPYPVDLALVLKTIPCLEQIDKQAGARLLGGLQARYLAVSFPAKSLGGRSKGMVENYSARFADLTAGRGWQVLGKLKFETELIFVVETSPSSGP